MSQFASDDLAGVLVAQDREFAGRAQGIIRAFNPATFENTVNVRGTDLHDLAVSASGVEALTYTAGDVVIVDKWKPRSGKGQATYAISSRWLEPAQGRAEESVAFMTSTLASKLTLGIIGNAVRVDFVDGSFSISSTAFADPDDGVGPTVPNLEVSDVGRILCFYGGFMTNMNFNPPSGLGTLSMSVELSGASSRAADISTSSIATIGRSVAAADVRPIGSPFTGIMWTDLNPGTHQVRGKYQVSFDLESAVIFNPIVIAIPF